MSNVDTHKREPRRNAIARLVTLVESALEVDGTDYADAVVLGNTVYVTVHGWPLVVRIAADPMRTGDKVRSALAAVKD